jgi:hypothetical protein
MVLSVAFYYSVCVKHGWLYRKFYQFVFGCFYFCFSIFGLERLIDDIAKTSWSVWLLVTSHAH